jgi:uncharacterized protein YfaS (alpha-2-macroglobulin family)
MSFSSCVSPDPKYKGETAILGSVKRDGAPVEGAYVRLLDGKGDFVGEIRSDGEGRFVFFANGGPWRLVVLAPGAERAEHDVELTQGQELEVTFELTAPAPTTA